eukprot:Pgem_evm1s12458
MQNNKIIISDPGPFNVLLTNYFAGGQVEEALRLVAYMKQTGLQLNSISYAILVHGLSKDRYKFGMAFDFFLELQKSGEVVPKKRMRAIYNNLIGICSKRQMIEKGLGYFEEMGKENIGVDLKTMNKLLDGLVRNGYYEKMFEYFKDIPTQHNLEPNLATYNIMLHGCLKASKITKAEIYFQEMEKKKLFRSGDSNGGSNDDSDGTKTFNTMIMGFCKLGDLEKSCLYFDKMVKANYKASTVTFNALIQCCGEKGLIDESLAWYQEMKKRNISTDPRTYMLLIAQCKKFDKIEQSIELTEEYCKKYYPKP